MKKVLAIAFLGIFLTALISSCGSSRVHCDAYDGRSFSMNNVENSDIPS